MGTNFYWKELPKELKKYEPHIYTITDDKHMNPLWHIGKRSGSGLYCIHCGITFCKNGTSRVHYNDNPYPLFSEEYKKAQKQYWYDRCPICGGEGDYVCSFTWTFMMQKYIIETYNNRNINNKLIVNEYDEEFTVKEFLEEELNNCFIEFQMCAEFS